MADANEVWFTLEMDVKPGGADAFLAAFAGVIDATRKEPGILQYDLLRDVKNPLKFNLVQRYTSSEASKWHMDQDYTKAGLMKLAGLLAKPYLQTDYKAAL